MTVLGLYASQNISSKVRYLAIEANKNPRPELTQDAPPLSQELGVELPEQSVSINLFASARCHTDHPDRYQKLVTGLETAMKDPDFQAAVKKLNQDGYFSFSPPEELTKRMDTELPELTAFYNGVLKGQ
jgi:tripartite-type tricarboxylate transporter receptor subunit TctC